MKRFIPAVLFVLAAAVPAGAQSFELGVHVASAQWSEFEGNDTGLGGRVTWRPLPLIGVDAELTFYPSEFGEDVAFSRKRVEGLFGATVGPRLNRVRPFVKAAGGFLNTKSTGAFACIAIFPPPLSCVLAGGATLPVYEIGGGISIDASSRTFIRADVAQRFLQYPGPTFRGLGLREIEDEDFFGGAVRFTVGGGIRF